MIINIKVLNMPLTDPLRDYVEKRLGTLGKFLNEMAENSIVDAEIGKTTNHHKLGNVFRAEFNLSLSGKSHRIRAVSEKDDLYAAIDDAKEELEREIVSFKGKKKTLFKRGAAMVKGMMKGIITLPMRPFRRGRR
jgi:ribosomal subunit interface protein